MNSGLTLSKLFCKRCACLGGATLAGVLLFAPPPLLSNSLPVIYDNDWASVSQLSQKVITVKGVVTDDAGVPLVGARVSLKSNPKIGTVTNQKGEFVLHNVKHREKLVIAYIGFGTLEIAAEESFMAMLSPGTEALGELVVVGYGSSRNISSTSASVVKVSAKDLESKPVPNVLDGIQGKVSGLNVFGSSGEPGQGVTIKLHGSGSLGLEDSPLYILDGVPVSSGTIMGMNPNDFESMTVLKDASATAIYGSRASNGVIYLTSKGGRSTDRAQITFVAQYGTSSLADKSFFNQFLSSGELAKFWVESGLKKKEYVDKFVADNPNDTRWVDYFYSEDVPLYNATLSVSGQTGKTSYYMSGQHFFQKGLMAVSEYRKSNYRINLNSKVNSWLKLASTNVLYYDNSLTTNTSSNSYVNEGLFYLNLPMYTPYKKDGTPYWDEVIPGVRFRNPKYVREMMPKKSTTFEYFGTLTATLTPFKGMTLMSRAGLDFSNYYYNALRSPLYKGKLENGYRKDAFTRNIEWTVTNTAEYRFEPLEGHDVSFLVGHEYNQFDGNSFSASGEGLKDYRLMHLNFVTDPEKRTIKSSLDQYAYLSFFGRFSYGLMDRYFLDLSVRNDASSKFPPKHRNAIFWSAGFKWNAKKESFLRGYDWLDKLDAKLSTGTAGNSGLGYYQYWATSATSDTYNGEISSVIYDPGNPDLTWETQQKTTLGFDVHFLNTFGFNLELYNRLTTNMVMDVPYPYTTGISSNVKNVGTYRNRGIDLTVDWDVWKNNKGDILSIYGNFNYNQDKILKLFQGLDTWPMPGLLLMYRVGEPVNFYMPIFKQINPDTGDPEWYLPGSDAGVTQKDDTKISVGEFNKEALMQNTGVRFNPPFGGGFGLSGSYAGFFMQADFTFYLGKHMISNDLFFAENPRQFANQNFSRTGLDYWKQKGDVVHLPDIKRYQKLMQFDTRMLQDASFCRLKALTVGYNVPKRFLNHQKFFRSAKLSLQGRNLLTFTKFNGPDPEPNTNLAYGRNPATKQMSINMELVF